MLDWTCPEKRGKERLCCCPWMEARGEEKQRQTQNYLASHCREGERQTRMEHMGRSEAGSKQPPAVEGRCLDLVCLLAQGELTRSGTPWLFIATACRVSENKRSRIVSVLMFPVSALIMKSFSLLSSIEKFISKLVNSMVNFPLKTNIAWIMKR